MWRISISDYDIRWNQRANRFDKAFSQMRVAVELAGRRQRSRLEAQGLVQGFAHAHELAWRALKDFLEARGVRELYGSRDTGLAAFSGGLIEDGETWMEMSRSRNLTAYTYNKGNY